MARRAQRSYLPVIIIMVCGIIISFFAYNRADLAVETLMDLQQERERRGLE